MGFRLAYLDLTMTHLNGHGQDQIHFDYAYV